MTWDEMYGKEKADEMRRKMVANRILPAQRTSFARKWGLISGAERDKKAVEGWVGMTHRITHRLTNPLFSGPLKSKWAAEKRKRMEEMRRRYGR